LAIPETRTARSISGQRTRRRGLRQSTTTDSNAIGSSFGGVTKRDENAAQQLRSATVV